jgi:hypothetical protein
MINKALGAGLLLAFVCSWLAAGQARTVELCEAVNHPEGFHGKRIRVQASFRYGFEWEELYCLGCWNTGRVWLEVAQDIPKSVQRKLDRLPRHQGTVNAVFTGVFHHVRLSLAGSSYSSQLILEDIDSVRVVSRSGAAPMALTQSQRDNLCQGQPTKPKHEEDHAQDATPPKEP